MKTAYERFVELHKDETDRLVAEGEARGAARGEAERQRLETENARLRAEVARLQELLPA